MLLFVKLHNLKNRCYRKDNNGAFGMEAQYVIRAPSKFFLNQVKHLCKVDLYQQ